MPLRRSFGRVSDCLPAGAKRRRELRGQTYDHGMTLCRIVIVYGKEISPDIQFSGTGESREVVEHLLTLSITGTRNISGRLLNKYGVALSCRNHFLRNTLAVLVSPVTWFFENVSIVSDVPSTDNL
jgi:hypothetical protein